MCCLSTALPPRLYLALMRRKLGLIMREEDGDRGLIADLLVRVAERGGRGKGLMSGGGDCPLNHDSFLWQEAMRSTGSDFCKTFRLLASVPMTVDVGEDSAGARWCRRTVPLPPPLTVPPSLLALQAWMRAQEGGRRSSRRCWRHAPAPKSWRRLPLLRCPLQTSTCSRCSCIGNWIPPLHLGCIY